ncbi:neurensin-1 [Hippoglossus hippoglossus]|uniref:neurensin-1 n=1 Tax=Hippoglossus hippoglossus TaxID=8267 RepID=UPI00148CE127|nr:neurensin-1 [Hippoglossus hippoglossus]XP_034467629.1 neurensin-1 [Hippoglossus hippoglossus]XP_035018726.1 neurensin-1 [Hippoglossus stenolepis]XP_035018728.1 neurensin-1 [Hippoglossus stenolepis]
MTSCPEICGSEYGEQVQASGNCQQYGVRSYLHQFYEECTASIWERDEDFQIQRSPSRWSSLLWKVCLVFGSLILVSGFIIVLVGYTTPTRIEAFGEDDLLFVDSHAVSFNRALDVCKLTGAVLFCVGGTSMAVGLLLSAFAKSYSKEELYLQQKFKERLADLHATVGTPIMRAPTPGEGKVPVTLSKVQNIQPANSKLDT